MKLNDIYKKITALDEAINEAASASINMSGDNAEDVIKLMNALKGTEGAKAGEAIPTAIKPAMNPMMGPVDPHDDMMSMMDLVSDKPKGMDMDKPGMDMDKPMNDMEPCGSEEDTVEGEWDNAPDEKYQDHNFMTKDIATGHDGAEKKSHGPVSGGDNPMALEDELRAELSAKLSEFMQEGGRRDMDCAHCDGEGKHGDKECAECGGTGEAQDDDVAESKAKPDFLDMDKDGDKKEPMKKAIKDKDAKKESVQEAVGDFAKPIYDLLDQLGDNAEAKLLDDLIRYLDADVIKDFVKEFRSNHEYDNGMEYESVEESDIDQIADVGKVYSKINKMKMDLVDNGMEPEDAQDEACEKYDCDPAMYDKYVEMKRDDREKVKEGDDKKVQLPSGKEMKKCQDKGMSKADIMKKYTEMGCESKQLEKLYASSCM